MVLVKRKYADYSSHGCSLRVKDERRRIAASLDRQIYVSNIPDAITAAAGSSSPFESIPPDPIVKEVLVQETQMEGEALRERQRSVKRSRYLVNLPQPRR